MYKLNQNNIKDKLNTIKTLLTSFKHRENNIKVSINI